MNHSCYIFFSDAPMLLGNPNLDPYTGYDPTVNVAMDAMFNEVALRYGHTQVNNVTWRLEEDGSHSSGGDILLRVLLSCLCLTVNRMFSLIPRSLSPLEDALQSSEDFKRNNTTLLRSTLLKISRNMSLPRRDSMESISFLPT